MSIARTTRAAPTGAASNTLASASFLAPSGQLCLVVGFQGGSTPGAAPLGIATSIAGITWTKVIGLETTQGGRSICIAMWRTIGNGNSGTVTVSNAALGSQTTDLRVYSFAGATQLDTSIDGVGAVVGSLGANAVAPFNFDLDPGAQSPWGNSHNMGFLIGLEATEVIWDIRNFWTEVEQWDSGVAVPASLQVIEQLGITSGQIDGDYLYKFMVSSGTTLGSAFIGASIRDASQQIKSVPRVLASRGGRIMANRF